MSYGEGLASRSRGSGGGRGRVHLCSAAGAEEEGQEGRASRWRHGSVGRTLSCSRARLVSSLLTLNRLLAIFSLGCPHPRRRANDVHSSGKSWPSVSFRATNGGGRQTLEHMKQSSKQVRITGSGRERTP